MLQLYVLCSPGKKAMATAAHCANCGAASAILNMATLPGPKVENPSSAQKIGSTVRGADSLDSGGKASSRRKRRFSWNRMLAERGTPITGSSRMDSSCFEGEGALTPDT